MSTIRVLRIIARMNVGGPALQAVALARGLDPDRFDQRLLVGSVDAGEADYLDLRAPDVTPQRIAGLGRSPNPLGDARAWASILGEIRRFRPHVVHTHTAKAGVLGRLAAVVSRCPSVVHTYHGHLLSGYFGPVATKAVVGVERILAKATTRLVAVGSQVRDDLLAAGIGRPDQYLVVPPGVRMGDGRLRHDARRELGIAADARVVAYVARLTSIKRPDRFIDVARHVLKSQPDVEFVVAGEGELLDQTRGLAAPLGDRVRFLGWRADVENVFAAADLAILTSDNEGMPVSLIEAAAAGCPAVTTDVGSASEVVLDGLTGFVTGRDPAQIATAALKILTNPALRQDFGQAATEHARAHFSEERLVTDLAMLYEHLAGSAAP